MTILFLVCNSFSILITKKENKIFRDAYCYIQFQNLLSYQTLKREDGDFYNVIMCDHPHTWAKHKGTNTGLNLSTLPISKTGIKIFIARNPSLYHTTNELQWSVYKKNSYTRQFHKILSGVGRIARQTKTRRGSACHIQYPNFKPIFIFIWAQFNYRKAQVLEHKNISSNIAGVREGPQLLYKRKYVL